jgi:hypothetical protein
MLDWLQANWFQVVSSSIFLALLGWLAKLWRDGKNRDRVVQIKRPGDPHIRIIEHIQSLFPPDEQDPPGLLAKKIAETKFDLFGRPQADHWMICLYHKAGGRVRGYLSAQYFVESQTIFFWYLVHTREHSVHSKPADFAPDAKAATEDETKELRDVAVDLIQKLLLICSAGPRPWQHLLAEVDAAGSDLKSAKNKVRRFQQYAEEISKRLNLKTGTAWRRVFKVDIPFMMPLHDKDELDHAKQHESPGWLVYTPRDADRYKTADERYVMAGDEVKGLLHSLLVLGYRDDADPEYNDYIRRFHQEMCEGVSDRVELICDRRRM